MRFIYPLNYDGGDTFFNIVDKDKAIKGGTTGIVLAIVGAFLPVSQKYKTIVIVALGILGFVTGFINIKGYTLSEYLLMLIAHHLNKRTLHYRPIHFRYFKSFEDMQKEEDELYAKEHDNNDGKVSSKMESLRNKIHEGEELADDDPASKSKMKRWLDANKLPIYKHQQYVQQFLPVEDIHDGIIQLNNGKYVQILQVDPINFSTMDEKSQIEVLQGFEGWLSMMEGQAQFKIVTERVNMNDYIEHFKEIQAQEKNEKCRVFDTDYINLIREKSSESGCVTHQFYLIQSFEEEGLKSLPKDEILEKFRDQAAIACDALYQCGNIVHYYPNEDMATWTTYEILYDLFNRKTHIVEPFESRWDRVQRDTIEAQGRDDVNILPNQIFAPRGIDLSESNYAIMDGIYYTYFFIDANSYPTEQTTLWLTRLFNLGEGFDIDVFIEKKNQSEMIDKVTRKITLREVDMNQELTPDKLRAIQNIYRSAKYIEEGLTDGASKEDFFYFSIMITLSDRTLKGLNKKKRTLKSTMARLRMDANECVNQEDVGLMSTMPFVSLQPNIKKKSQRNILTSGLASLYPFISYEMSDNGGVFFGINDTNSTLAMLNLFDTSKHMNANMFIVGTSGAGKSYSLMLLALRMRRMGVQVFIIAPLKGHEFRPSCEKIGGEYINMAAQTINIMEIRETAHVDESLLSSIDANVNDSSPLTKKIEKLMTFFDLINPGMNNRERSYLNVKLKELYNQFGITDEPDGYKNADGSIKTMPILEDFYNYLNEDKDNEIAKSIRDAMGLYVQGTYGMFSGQTNVDLTNLYTVIDISTLSDEILPVAMFVAMDYVYDIMKSDITQNNLLFIDELWRLLKEDQSQSVKDFVLELFKIVRGYGGGAVAATQDIADMNEDRYGKGVISACPTKLILKLENQEIQRLTQVMNLTPSDVSLLNQIPGKGFGVLWVNSNKVPIQIIGSQMEHQLITTDAQERKQMKEAEEAKAS